MSCSQPLNERFRGYYPIVIDVETGGINPEQHALLDIAAITLTTDKQGKLIPLDEIQIPIHPHPECDITPEALKINKIDLKELQYTGLDEKPALEKVFDFCIKAQMAHQCSKCILVGHNAFFDLAFINAAARRHRLSDNPFHRYNTFDTVTLGGVMLGHTVLVKQCELAGIPFERKQAHAALYDAQKTAELFCHLVNRINPPHRGL